MDAQHGCGVCGFSLWTPLAALSVSHVGLYDDGRFPGRMIVSLDAHFEHLDELDEKLLARFFLDVRRASLASRSLDGVERTNVSVLGNQVAHVHAHVIPRRVSDANAGRAPWDGAAPRTRLAEDELVELSKRLLVGLSVVDS